MSTLKLNPYPPGTPSHAALEALNQAGGVEALASYIFAKAVVVVDGCDLVEFERLAERCRQAARAFYGIGTSPVAEPEVSP